MAKRNKVGCNTCVSDYNDHDHDHARRAGRNHNNGHKHRDDHDNSHNHGNGKFNSQKQAVSFVLSIILFVMGFVFEKPLHNTPFSIDEYLVFVLAYLLSGWTVLTIVILLNRG